MRFVLAVLDEGTDPATDGEMSAIDAFNEGLRTGGHWVMAAGIEPPSAGTIVDNRGTEPVLIHGDWDDADEHVSGFWIIEAPSRDVAVELASAGSKACNRKVEVRAFLG